MSEEIHDPRGDEAAGHAGQTPASTGHPAVDEVLRSLDGLADRPVSEHVAVFEAAHEGLRGALSDAGRDAGPDAG